ncbi:MAG: hypothetical protein GDA43_05425 [Hormoscilla sp. SP5CHS1]|nr:hypothetical protein [Hormoscilla sp. SP12CHS1]MBC6452700.1 hypothetical protein [Hormoscilla sp. SP5CHS1]
MSTTADTPNNLPTEELGENRPLDDIPGATNSLESTVEATVQDMLAPDPDQISAEVRVESNTDLIDRVMQLESELAVAQRQLQLYQEHCQAQEAKLSDFSGTVQSAELHSLKKNHSQVQQEKKLGKQTSDSSGTVRQQILIETLRGQLETNQQQVAQLERDCALTQQRYEEQTTKLSQAETICRDLRSRLYRQQRYTLQFKNALDKCLEMTGPEQSADFSGTVGRSTQQETYARANAARKIVQGVVPKAPAIQPWSAASEYAELELDPDFSRSGGDPERVPEESDAVPGQAWGEPDYCPISGDTSTVDFSRRLVCSLVRAPVPQQEQPRETLGVSESAASEELASPENELSVMAPVSEQLEDEYTDFSGTVVGEDLTDETVAAAVDDSSSIGNEQTPEDSLSDVWDVSGDIPSTFEQQESHQSEEQASEEGSDFSGTVDASCHSRGTPPSRGKRDGVVSLDTTETLSLLSSTKSPSPLVYPLRPHKKIKSLAAIDLPTFPR